MSAVLNFDTALVSHTCGECGITWAQPQGFTNARRTDGKSFYCPNGHVRVFRETDVEQLRKEMQAQIDRKERELKWAAEARDRYRRQAEDSKRSHAATKGLLTKTRNRISKGVCPCCNRTFQDLARHMHSKHPDYSKSD